MAVQYELSLKLFLTMVRKLDTAFSVIQFAPLQHAHPTGPAAERRLSQL